MLSIKLISIYSIFAIILGGLGYFLGDLLSPNNRSACLAGAAVGIIIGIVLANYITVQYKIEPYSFDDFVNQLRLIFVEAPSQLAKESGHAIGLAGQKIGEVAGLAGQKIGEVAGGIAGSLRPQPGPSRRFRHSK